MPRTTAGDAAPRVQGRRQKLCINPCHSNHHTRVYGVGAKVGLVDSGQPTDKPADRMPLALPGDRWAGNRRNRRGWWQVCGGRRGGNSRSLWQSRRRRRGDRPLCWFPPHRRRVMRIPRVLCPRDQRPTAVAAEPFRESRRHTCPQALISKCRAQRPPYGREKDRHEHEHARDLVPAHPPDAAAHPSASTPA